MLFIQFTFAILLISSVMRIHPRYELSAALIAVVSFASILITASLSEPEISTCVRGNSRPASGLKEEMIVSASAETILNSALNMIVLSPTSGLS